MVVRAAAAEQQELPQQQRSSLLLPALATAALGLGGVWACYKLYRYVSVQRARQRLLIKASLVHMTRSDEAVCSHSSPHQPGNLCVRDCSWCLPKPLQSVANELQLLECCFVALAVPQGADPGQSANGFYQGRLHQTSGCQVELYALILRFFRTVRPSFSLVR